MRRISGVAREAAHYTAKAGTLALMIAKLGLRGVGKVGQLAMGGIRVVSENELVRDYTRVGVSWALATMIGIPFATINAVTRASIGRDIHFIKDMKNWSKRFNKLNEFTINKSMDLVSWLSEKGQAAFEKVEDLGR